MTDFNTVVLFDVENLLGPPTGWQTAATTLSFGDILAQIGRDDSGRIGGFAVSRAYANWGQGFMETLRREMTENGVEPRQIFGFSATKNAADIELVIDALDLAYLRPGLSTFVLVTRDGGFSALVRKLHELGKFVVVCADAGCSHTLRSVADVFIDLPQPGEALAPVEQEPSEQILDETRTKVVAEVERLARAQADRLDAEGIPLTIVGDRFAKAIPGLGEVRSGYAGLKEFLQWALVGTPYSVINKIQGPEGAKPRLGRRSRAPRGFRQLPNLERRAPRKFADAATLYRFLASQGEPYLRLAGDPQSTAQVLRQVAATGIRDEELPKVTERVAKELSGTVPAADVRFTILSLASSGAISEAPSSKTDAERRYRVDGAGAGALREALLAAVREKLEPRLGTIDEGVLQGLVEPCD